MMAWHKGTAWKKLKKHWTDTCKRAPAGKDRDSGK